MPVLETYTRLMEIGSQDVFWATTRALTIEHVRSTEWLEPVLEIGGQNGIVSDIIGRPIDTMIDTEPDIYRWGKVYKNVIKGNGEKTPFPDNSFNTVVALNVVYHMNRHNFINEAFRVLRPGGLLVFTDTPGYEKILTWPYLLRRREMVEPAKIYEIMELDYHKVFPILGAWQKYIDPLKWAIISDVGYASVDMCLIARAHYTIRNLAGLVRVPDVENIFEDALSLANRIKEIRGMLFMDDELCRDSGSVFEMKVLRKKSATKVFYREAEDADGNKFYIPEILPSELVKVPIPLVP